MSNMKKVIILLLLVTVLMAMAVVCEAGSIWKPTAPMTLICSEAPGGAYDSIARQIARVMPDYLGAQIIVQNVAGGGGLIAVDRLIRSKPDGQTFMFTGLGTHTAMALNEPLERKSSELKIPMAIMADAYGLMASVKRPYRSFNDVLRSKERLRISVAGTNLCIVGIVAFFEEKKIPYTVARFPGTKPAEIPVRAGDADLFPAAMSSIGLSCYLDGDCTPPILTFADKRDPRYPDAPTHIEVGMPKEWSSLRIMRPFVFAPNVPDDRVGVISDALVKALKDSRSLEWGKKADVPMDFVDSAIYKKKFDDLLEIYKRYPEHVKKYLF